MITEQNKQFKQFNIENNISAGNLSSRLSQGGLLSTDSTGRFCKATQTIPYLNKKKKKKKPAYLIESFPRWVLHPSDKEGESAAGVEQQRK